MVVWGQWGDWLSFNTMKICERITRTQGTEATEWSRMLKSGFDYNGWAIVAVRKKEDYLWVESKSEESMQKEGGDNKWNSRYWQVKTQAIKKKFTLPPISDDLLGFSIVLFTSIEYSTRREIQAYIWTIRVFT